MRILISGSSGLIGRVLNQQLPKYKHSVTRLMRFGPGSGSEAAASGLNVAAWDPEAELLDPTILEEHDCIISLNGANIAAQRWSRNYKQELRDSRLLPTRLLADMLSRSNEKLRPRLWISASAVGYYGNHGGEKRLDEGAPAGEGFLAELCRDWEAATAPAAAAGVRVVNLRFGVVLDPDEGALGQLISLFNKGMAGVVGNGRQMFSWVGAQELPSLVAHVIATEELRGPVNACAPNPVSQRELIHTLAEKLGKRPGLTAPAMMVRAVLGEMADETLIGGQNAYPRKLVDSGYEFKWPLLSQALETLLRPV